MEPENMKILYNSSNINITPARYLRCSESKVVPFENFLRQIMFKVLMSFGRIFDLIFFKNPPQFDNNIKGDFKKKLLLHFGCWNVILSQNSESITNFLILQKKGADQKQFLSSSPFTWNDTRHRPIFSKLAVWKFFWGRWKSMSPPTNPVQVHNFHAPANRLRPGEKKADCEEPFLGLRGPLVEP